MQPSSTTSVLFLRATPRSRTAHQRTQAVWLIARARGASRETLQLYKGCLLAAPRQQQRGAKSVIGFGAARALCRAAPPRTLQSTSANVGSFVSRVWLLFFELHDGRVNINKPQPKRIHCVFRQQTRDEQIESTVPAEAE